MSLVHKTKKEEGKKHKTKKKTQKKQQIFKIKLRNDKFRMFGPHSKLISAVSAWFKANFGLFRPFWSVSAANRYDSIQPIRSDSGRIDPIQRKSARIEAESAQIHKKIKNKKTQTQHQRVGSGVTRALPSRTQVRRPFCRVHAS